ncbi:MAG: dTMP kinase, partial [Phycisphaerae bacterium]|nr:dTMP kinase [Phycisphaerae bacterium]
MSKARQNRAEPVSPSTITMDDLRGKFIVFDGGEGCGKSTQAKMLLATLEQARLPAILVHDPGTTRVGKIIRSILLDPANTDISMRCEMLLYMAARAQMMTEIILPALASAKVVLCDRFVSSTLSYQLGGDGLTFDEIHAVGETAIHHRWPDLTIVLDMPVARSFLRVKPKFTLFPDQPFSAEVKDRIEQRPTAYHEQVRKNYLQQASHARHRYEIIDADRDADAIHQDVLAAV